MKLKIYLLFVVVVVVVVVVGSCSCEDPAVLAVAVTVQTVRTVQLTTSSNSRSELSSGHSVPGLTPLTSHLTPHSQQIRSDKHEPQLSRHGVIWQQQEKVSRYQDCQ